MRKADPIATPSSPALFGRRRWLILSLAIGLSASLRAATTTWPSLINFQGQLTDGTGAAVSDTAYSIQFLIYDSADCRHGAMERGPADGQCQQGPLQRGAGQRDARVADRLDGLCQRPLAGAESGHGPRDDPAPAAPAQRLRPQRPAPGRQRHRRRRRQHPPAGWVRPPAGQHDRRRQHQRAPGHERPRWHLQLACEQHHGGGQGHRGRQRHGHRHLRHDGVRRGAVPLR